MKYGKELIHTVNAIVYTAFVFLWITTITASISHATILNIYESSPVLATNATHQLTLMLDRLTFVVNIIAGSIIGIVWIYEALFLILHKEDRDGLLKFKRDVPVMILATVIIFGAATIVNVLSWIGHG